MKEKTYNDYTLDEKLIYAKGWNAAIEAAAKVVDQANRDGPYQAIMSATEIIKLYKSIQACDD